MRLTYTPLPGLWILEPKVFEDARGWFFESYNEKVFEELGITAKFVQDNVSFSRKGVLRGLHYQLAPMSQGKLVRVSRGEVFDVVVDIRRDSETFGKWFGLRLSEQNKKMVWIPPGFAHGFLVLSDTAEFNYKVTNFYSPEHERTLRYDDQQVGIEWPTLEVPLCISEKDQKGQALKDIEINF
ncbi:MAG: dTDP-4-dehydrorhamnose 3,5-epimerase [Candidatus Thermochlorobacter aerophilum]|jgi:dTDP-4-dehydrorhamnose 3,5-epimerase|uniref:dTDP-4-dehydrorhamnose 3,5-epimerase n=1 Tax=Candidatus Thermochlorobacter aerophilus TaxID=1868324 RepID=A0A395M0C8_9BACT|nr:MAG: dTDP-4-dehydrorhamnose 3,5-epimerase [Candidatus Thermochlorobacter aerophilum]